MKKYVTYGNSCAIIIKKLCDMTALKWVNGMVEGDVRREKLLDILKNSSGPVSGSSLSRLLGVSRQVIVQDIALMRAAGYDIISTNRGYILNSPKSVKRIFKVQHTDEQMEDELYSIVDLGGCVETVIVNHKVYGRMEAKLHITSRRLAWEFLEDIRSGKSSPLKNITSNYHYHEVHADSEETLDMIENMLREKGYLVED